MKTNNIARKVETFVQRQKNIRQEKQIQKYFKLDYDLLGTDAYSKLYEARKTIANYAKANDMFVSIEQHKTCPIHESFTNHPTKMDISVRAMKDKSANNRYHFITDTDVNAVYPVVSERNIILPIRGEDVEIARTVKSHAEDNFLRHVYRNIETLKDYLLKSYKK